MPELLEVPSSFLLLATASVNPHLPNGKEGRSLGKVIGITSR
jgi:hypothetical protein